MKRITVSVPDELDTLVRREASRRGMGTSELVRLCLTEVLVGRGERRSLPFAGLVREPSLAPSDRVDEALENEGWADEIAGDRG